MLCAMRWMGLGFSCLVAVSGCQDATCGEFELYEPEGRCICPGTAAMPIPPDDDGNCPGDFDATVSDGGLDGGVDSAVDAFDGGCPEATWYRDSDGDTYGVDDDTMVGGCTAPEGFAERAGDCNDECRTCNPERTEVCDELDNDCDDAFDEELPSIACFRDQDEDGFGRLDVTMMACGCPVGWVENVVVEDCYDWYDEVFPGQTEYFDSAYCTAPDGGLCFRSPTIPIEETGWSWDYDCDGSVQQEFEVSRGCENETGTCRHAVTCAGCIPQTCGEEIEAFVSCNADCDAQTVRTTQACH